MNHKILVADDSLTIQKVIKITLSSGPYELKECSQFSDVVREASSNEYHLCLLDFSLVENRSGHDLARELKDLAPQIKIIMLYGTFDTIDEEQLHLVAEGKIVKPFDSVQLLNLCREILTSGPQEPVIKTEDPDRASDADQTNPSFNLEAWKVQGVGANRPMPQEKAPTSKENLNQEINPLKALALDWGMEVPPMIGNDDLGPQELPPVITAPLDEVTDPQFKFTPQAALEIEIGPSLRETQNKPLELDPKNLANTRYPAQEDLEYPDISLFIDPNAPEEAPVPVEPKPLKNYKVTSRMISEDELAGVQEKEPAPVVTKNEVSSGRQSMEGKIYDKDMARDFWTDTPHEEGPAKIKFFPDEPKPSAPAPQELDLEKLRPMLEEMVKKHCQETIERIAWEIIPDLAENLIRDEIAKINQSILKKN